MYIGKCCTRNKKSITKLKEELNKIKYEYSRLYSFVTNELKNIHINGYYINYIIHRIPLIYYIYLYIYIYIYIYIQSWAVSPIQYLLKHKISIVDTFVFVFVSIIKIKKVFVIVQGNTYFFNPY